ncbi:Beta-ketoadipyl-CoA thiolase [archaeon HR01]|nr:Beta-ketoadipyl-CoA thiolase [archaeon HR01]
MDVYVAGVGEIPCRPAYGDLDFREMLYTAARKAYEDAGIHPSEIDGIVSSGMDFYEGISITDSYTPDQVGGRLKFNTLVSNDSLNAFIHGYMLLRTGHFRNLMVTCYAKPSNMLNYPEVVLNSFDPHVVRPLTPHPYVLAALDARAYLSRSGASPRDLSLVAVKNKKNALGNTSAAYAGATTPDDVENSAPVSEPLKRGHISTLCDYAAAVILTTDRRLGRFTVKGVGNAFGAYSSDLSSRMWGLLAWVRHAAQKALRMAGIGKVDFVEVSEPFAHTELMALEGLGIDGEPAHKTLRAGGYDLGGHLPVNPSGGCLGMGYPLNAAGLQRVVQSVKAMSRMGWRTCMILSSDGEVVDAGSAVVLTSEV